jgi:epoxyqueuosine reductase QueG
MEVKCGGCRKCVDVCPVKAFTGVPFNPSEPRDVRFKAQLCYEYSKKREEKIGAKLCGLCVYVCPYGKQTKII